MPKKKNPDVLVVGAGPVGLFAAISLARRGVATRIVDKEWRTGAHSYALALHSGSLRMLKDLGLAERILEGACLVRTIGLYDGAERRAEMRVSELGGDYPFLAVMRQDSFEGLLEEALTESSAEVLWNHRVSDISAREDRVAVSVDKMAKETVGYAAAHTEWVVAKTNEFEVPFVIGADGHQSQVRRGLDLGYQAVGEPQHFATFEFKSDVDLDGEMRLVMDERTTSVLWPLPGGYCRWSFQLEDFVSPEESRDKERISVQLGSGRYPVLDQRHLVELVEERAPWFNGNIGEINWRIAVRFEQRLAESFGGERIWLAGDAGHMTGPVGVQSMNVGLREAAELAGVIEGVLQGKDEPGRLEQYNGERVAEWRHLLGLEGGLKAEDDANPWVRERAERLLPCIPASGSDLVTLAAQLRLKA